MQFSILFQMSFGQRSMLDQTLLWIIVTVCRLYMLDNFEDHLKTLVRCLLQVLCTGNSTD